PPHAAHAAAPEPGLEQIPIDQRRTVSSPHCFLTNSGPIPAFLVATRAGCIRAIARKETFTASQVTRGDSGPGAAGRADTGAPPFRTPDHPTLTWHRWCVASGRYLFDSISFASSKGRCLVLTNWPPRVAGAHRPRAGRRERGRRTGGGRRRHRGSGLDRNPVRVRAQPVGGHPLLHSAAFRRRR